MKSSRIIDRLVIVTLLCLCSIYVDAGCPKQLGKDALLNLQTPLQGQEPRTCVSSKTCCTRRLETTLQQKAVSELNSKVVKRLDGVKASTAAIQQDVRGYFKVVVQTAKGKSLQSLRQSHKNLSRIGGPLVETYFNQLEDSIHNHNINFTSIVLQFLKNSFPPLYHYATTQSKRFSNQYEKCLKENMNYKELYGSTPNRIAGEIKDIMKPIQSFLQGLTFAEKAIQSATKLNFTKGCSRILLQMTYCPRCNGEDDTVKPCEGYCIDVLKNCLVTSQGKLHRQWSLFFDAMDRLAVGLSTSAVEDRLYQVYNKLSMAVIMVLQQVHAPHLQTKLNMACGSPSYAMDKASSSQSSKGFVQTVIISLKVKMQDVKTKMGPLRSVFEEMPRDICVFDRVSALRTEKIIVANCWNGTAIGRYFGPVSSPLPFLDTLPADKFRTDVLVQETEKIIIDIKKYTPVYVAPDNIDGSGESGSGESGCDSDDEDCVGSTSGEGSANGIDKTDSPPTEVMAKDNDIDFASSDPVQDGGVNDQAKAKNAAHTLSLAPVVLLPLLILLVRI